MIILALFDPRKTSCLKDENGLLSVQSARNVKEDRPLVISLAYRHYFS